MTFHAFVGRYELFCVGLHAYLAVLRCLDESSCFLEGGEVDVEEGWAGD
jgi:hypothetical protein